MINFFDADGLAGVQQTQNIVFDVLLDRAKTVAGTDEQVAAVVRGSRHHGCVIQGSSQPSGVILLIIHRGLDAAVHPC